MPGPSPTADPSGDRAAAAVAPAPDEILDVVRSRLTETIGPENLLDVSIDVDTSFDADLEMDSIEFVALMERLGEDYGEDLDVIAWLSSLEFEQIVELTVGDLVTFIASSVR